MVARGLTAYALSKAGGVPQQTLSNLLRGERRPTWETVCRLAEALGVTPNDFLPG
jgi:transcriptional regulator with XRE-family HTH domain